MIAGADLPLWREIDSHANDLAAVPVRELFANEPQRAADFSAEGCGFVLDYARQRIDRKGRDLLLDLTEAMQMRARIAAMFRGDLINATEGRAVLHTALRRAPGTPLPFEGRDLMTDVLRERERVLDFAERVRSGAIAGSSGRRFELVVNIGIGGSDLGPAMAVEALRQFVATGTRHAFVSNVDGCRLADVLAGADPYTTLFIVCSKTFTTQETLSNARVARAWLAQRLGESAVPAHFAAVSVNRAAMDQFAIHPEYRFAMWDWVGGRYSLWSAIGVSLAIAIGRANFEEFLAGAAAMDEHFQHAPWRANLPVLLAVIGIWNTNFLGLPTLAVLPYDDRLARFPAYLQQLEMESNGKTVRMDGATVSTATAPVIWGEPGNNAQHSFFQMLHQGTPRVALDFILPVQSSCGSQEQQDLAIANCLAQAEAFAYGQSAAQVHAAPELVPHKVHAGGRPSSLLVFERLRPATLGGLIALYEHKVFAQSVFWGINAFDQWGVELGKKLCDGIVPFVRTDAQPESQSLLATLARIKPWRET